MTKRVFACGLLALAAARVYDFEVDGGAKADDDSAALANAAALNASLAALAPGDALRVPNKTFTIMGGVVATGLRDVTLALEGTLRLSDDIDAWPIGARADGVACQGGVWTRGAANRRARGRPRARVDARVRARIPSQATTAFRSTRSTSRTSRT